MECVVELGPVALEYKSHTGYDIVYGTSTRRISHADNITRVTNAQQTKRDTTNVVTVCLPGANAWLHRKDPTDAAVHSYAMIV